MFFRVSTQKAVVFAFFATFFKAFDVPVFWPILVIYFIVLFALSMKKQIGVRCTLLFSRLITVTAYDQTSIHSVFVRQTETQRQRGSFRNNNHAWYCPGLWKSSSSVKNSQTNCNSICYVLGLWSGGTFTNFERPTRLGTKSMRKAYGVKCLPGPFGNLMPPNLLTPVKISINSIRLKHLWQQNLLTPAAFSHQVQIWSHYWLLWESMSSQWMLCSEPLGR